jgi:hypothetical protein
MQRSTLAQRQGGSPTRDTIVAAAVIAAHGAAPAGRGFRLSDVRFFFFLFSNWLERDLLRATEALELTQVRRLLARMTARRWARAGTDRRHVLTAGGLVGLVEEITADLEMRSLAEALFIVCFAQCYGAAIVARAPAPRRRALADRLSPDRLLRDAERRIERITADLDERVRTSEAMQREARALRSAGLAEQDVAAALDRRDAYQLQHVRAFGEIMRALPADLLRFEMDAGLEIRSKILFAPLAALARAERSIVVAIRESLRTLT